MSNIDPPASWADVDGINTNERLLGGPSGPLNRAVTALTARSKQLRDDQTEAAAALAAADGATSVGFARSATGAVLVTAADIFSNYLSVLQAGAVPDVEADSTASFQRAINWIVALAEARGSVTGLPAIIIPGGAYKFSDTLTSKPWVHLVSDGPVFLDFTAIDPAKPGIVCNNTTTVPTGTSRFSANHSPFLDGTRGTIYIQGPGRAVSTAAALRLGNYVAGQKPFRDARIANVVVSEWNTAQQFGNFDTYLCRTENCRFEAVNYAVSAVGGANTNSGERMEWSGCTFAGTVAAVQHNQVGFDANFYGCSFDFNDDVLLFGSSSTFCAVRFEHCYFEAFLNFIVDGALLTSTANANQVCVMLTDPIILARGRQSQTGQNSPSRTMFRGAFSLSMNAVKSRYEARPYLEDATMFAPTVSVVASSGYNLAPYQLAARPNQTVNDDYDFQRDADGTLSTALTSWERVAATGTYTAQDLFTVSGKKVLRMAASTGANTSSFTFRSKDKVPCRHGDNLLANVCLNAGSATGSMIANTQVEFYSSSDQLLDTLPAFAQYNFRDALNDTNLPNYAEGNSRWMDTNGFRAVAPKNANYAKLRFSVSGFDGTMYVSRARLWRG